MPQTVCTCGTKLEYPEAHAGKKLRCPRCQAIVQAPAAPALPPEDAIMTAELVPEPPRDAYRGGRPQPRDDYDDRRRPGYRDGRWPDPEPPRPSSGKATASLIFDIASFVFSILASLPSILLGILALRDCSRNNLAGRGSAITGIVLSCVLPLLNGLIILGFYAMQGSRDRIHAMNNMKQIALAWHNHHDAMGKFPASNPPFRPGDMGNRFNWRVEILPFIEQQGLFQILNRRVAIDAPPNNALLNVPTPMVYQHKARPQEPTKTLFQTTVGAEALFRDGSDGIRFLDITDGTSNTFIVLEGQDAVTWPEPKDLRIDPQQPLPLPMSPFLAAMGDGSVRMVDRRRVDDRTLRLIINPRDGMPAAFDF